MMRAALLAVGLLWLMTTAPAAQSHTLVALSHSDYTAYELDPSTGRVQVLKNLGEGAGRMAVSPDGRWAASTHSGTQDVAVIDANAKTVAARVKLGRGPGFPVFSPDSSKLYVMNSGEGDVAVVDLKEMKVTGRHYVGTNPFGGGLRTR